MSGGAGSCWAALYTKQLTKKSKVYHDGFVVVSGSTCSLHAEDGKVLASGASLPPGLKLDSDTEGITLFDGFLVNLDGPGTLPNCGAGEVSTTPEATRASPDHPDNVVVQTKHAFSRRRPVKRKAGMPGMAEVGQKVEPTSQSMGMTIQPAPSSTEEVSTSRTDDEILDILRNGIAWQNSSDRRIRQGSYRHVNSNVGGVARAPRVAATERYPLGSTRDNRPTVPGASDGAQFKRQENQDKTHWIPVSNATSRNTATLHPYVRKSEGCQLNAHGNSVAIRFPRLADISSPRREVAVPAEFENWMQYATIWTNALHEELNLRANAIAQQLHRVLAAEEVAPNGNQPSRIHITSNPALGSLLQRKMAGIYYSECELVVKEKRWQSEHQRRPMDDDDAPRCIGKKQAFLVLKSGVRNSSQCRRDDIWPWTPQFLCSDVTFSQGEGNPRSQRKVITARSLWHGPDRDGRMEVQVLNFPMANLPKSQRVYGIQGPNATVEFAAIQLLQQQAPEHGSDQPLIRALLNAQQDRCPTDGAGDVDKAITFTADSISSQFNLNQEQSSVISSSISQWFSPSWELTAKARMQKAPGNPVCLIHGPFGTGKSSLLIAIIHFIAKEMERMEQSRPKAAANSRLQILISAHTNVAIDRLLTGLLSSGFTDIIRVGSVKRITDTSLLRYSLHCSEGKRSTDAIDELKQMLGDAATGDVDVIRSELAALKAGAEKERKRGLKTARVVGVTCCSATLPVLKDRSFEVLVLDEASQMVEPLSLLPILVSKCSFLVAAGDPCQLPPVIASPSVMSDGCQGLARPLFVRLQSAGHSAHLLKRQYRCHPQIAEVPNQHFYQGKLLHGCTSEQRLPLLPGLPPVSFIDVCGEEQRQGNSGSVSNHEEAVTVAKVLRLLVGGGVPEDAIGVICFFRAQVQAVTKLLAKPSARPLQVNVATVDSFQGMEKDIIILSTAVTRVGSGFTSDNHRLNVAFTRARNHMLVVGSASVLAESSAAFSDILSLCSRMPGAICRHGQTPGALLHAATVTQARA